MTTQISEIQVPDKIISGFLNFFLNAIKRGLSETIRETSRIVSTWLMDVPINKYIWVLCTNFTTRLSRIGKVADRNLENTFFATTPNYREYRKMVFVMIQVHSTYLT